MTTRHTEPLVCECGHKGAVLWKENDAPFTRQYEEYSLSGFTGEGFHVDGYTNLTDALTRLNPKCPSCGAVGKASYS